jgi:hypothetical protein
MNVIESDERPEVADLHRPTELYLRLCGCSGPQPGTSGSRAEEHLSDCQYRREVEGEGQ